MLFNFSKLKHPPAPLSVCQATISFSDSVRNLGFYLYKDSLWKNTSISSAKLLSCKSEILVLFTSTSLMIPLKPFLFLSSSHALTIATLSWLVSLSPWSANFRVQNSAARLVVHALPHVHVTPVLRHSHWFPVRARISCKIVRLCFNAITSSTLLISDLLHLHSPSRSLRPSADTRRLKIPLYKYKTKGDRAFPYFGPFVWNSLPLHIRNATTIDTFKSALKNLCLQPPRIWLAHICLICSV